MIFTGNTAPYHITQPSTDYDVQIVSSTATMANLICSLNVTIPSSVAAFWMSNSYSNTRAIQSGSGTTLLLENFEQRNALIYQCVFKDVSGSGWTLRRNIRLIITSMYMHYR